MTSLNGFVLRYDGKDSFDNLISISGGTKFGDLTLGSTWCGEVRDDGKGFRLDGIIGLEKKKVRAGAWGELFSPGYMPILGYTPYEPRKGIGVWANYSDERFLRGNNILILGISADRYWHYDGGVYMGRINPSISVNLRRGTTESYGFGLHFNMSKYEEFEDRYGGTGFGFSWRHPKDLASFGASVCGSYGRRQEKGYLYLTPSIMLTFGKDKVIVSYDSEFIRHGDESRRQDIVWLNINITPEHGIGSRFVWREGKWNWYISYRQGVRKGTDIYLIVGDPNAQEFQRRALLKLVTPLW